MQHPVSVHLFESGACGGYTLHIKQIDIPDEPDVYLMKGCL